MAKRRKKKLKTRTTGKKKTAKAAKRPSAKKSRRTAEKTKKATKKTIRKSKKKTAARTPSPRKTAKQAMIERELEEGLIETFPASDAVAVTDPTTTIKE